MELEKLPRKTQLLLAFLVATIVLSTVGALDTLNYVQYFPALEQLRVNVQSLQYRPNNSSLNGNVTLQFENPTGYTGLGLQALNVNFTIIANESTTIPQGVISYTIFPATLDPSSMINYTLPLDGNGNGPSTVTQTLKTGGTIRFIFSVDVFLKTFLDAVYRTSIPYQCTNNQIPASCDQIGILILSKNGGPSGGGGR